MAFRNTIFSGYVGMYGMPPFPIDLWIPCNEPLGSPIEQRYPLDNPVLHETIKTEMWTRRQGPTRPSAFATISDTITQENIVRGGPPSLAEVDRTWLNYGRYFGPPIPTAGIPGMSIFFAVKLLGGSFSWNVTLNGVMRTLTSGTTGTADFWNGNDDWIAGPTNTNFGWKGSAGAGQIRGFLLSFDNATKQHTINQFFPLVAGTTFQATLTTPAATAMGSSFTLMMYMSNKAQAIGDIYIWRRALTQNEKIVVGQALIGST